MSGKCIEKLFLAIGCLILTPSFLFADTITKPHTFTAGNPAVASDVNDNFDTVYDQVNKMGASIDVDLGTGNVGVGTVAPATSKLDVAGEISVNGNVVVDVNGQWVGIPAHISGNNDKWSGYATVNSGSTVAMVSVPADKKLIITDIEKSSVTLLAIKEDNSINFYSGYGSNSLRSGLVFNSGTTVNATNTGGSTYKIFMSGYFIQN